MSIDRGPFYDQPTVYDEVPWWPRIDEEPPTAGAAPADLLARLDRLWVNETPPWPAEGTSLDEAGARVAWRD